MTMTMTMTNRNAWPLALLILAAGGDAWAQPTFSMGYTPSLIGPGSTSRLAFAIDNAAGGPASNVAFV